MSCMLVQDGLMWMVKRQTNIKTTSFHSLDIHIDYIIMIALAFSWPEYVVYGTYIRKIIYSI